MFLYVEFYTNIDILPFPWGKKKFFPKTTFTDILNLKPRIFENLSGKDRRLNNGVAKHIRHYIVIIKRTPFP